MTIHVPGSFDDLFPLACVVLSGGHREPAKTELFFFLFSTPFLASLSGYSQFSVGPSSQVCGPAVCYWRHHGATHRLLHHQLGGDNLFHGQNSLEYSCKSK